VPCFCVSGGLSFCRKFEMTIGAKSLINKRVGFQLRQIDTNCRISCSSEAHMSHFRTSHHALTPHRINKKGSIDLVVVPALIERFILSTAVHFCLSFKVDVMRGCRPR
jgi:hypothetical protein